MNAKSQQKLEVINTQFGSHAIVYQSVERE